MKISEALNFLETAINNQWSVLLVGDPGIGKSAICRQASERVGANYLYTSAYEADHTDGRGMPCIVDGKGKYVPFEHLYRIVHTDKKTVMMIDDVTQADPPSQKSFLKLIHEKMVGEYKISKNVTFIGATNDYDSIDGGYNIISPFISRWHTILHVTLPAEDWLSWAWSKNVHPIVCGYIKAYPQALGDFTEWKKSAYGKINNYVCGRSLEHLSDILHIGCYTDCQEEDIVSGTIGQARTPEFVAYAKQSKSLPEAQTYIDNPKQKLPDDTLQKISLASAIAYVADCRNVLPACQVIEKFSGELQAYILSAIAQRLPKFFETQEFISISKKFRKIT